MENKMENKMENHENRTTIASILTKSDSVSEQHGRTQSDKDESPHPSLRFHSPPRSDQPLPPEPSLKPSPDSSPENISYSMAIVPVDHKYFHNSPHQSPSSENQKSPENANFQADKVQSPEVVINRSMMEQQSPAVNKVGPGGGGNVGERFGSGNGEEGRGEKRAKGRGLNTTVRRSQKEEMVNRAALGFRVCEVVLCLVSFSVMAADKTQGWSGDSFHRYKEYRYCLSVTVIAFVYSGFQACDLAYHWIMEKHMIQHHLRYHFDFIMDQILAYLLISASSSAATRVDDWQSNWGKDEFTEMVIASISMSFLAFAAFALSSLISGYNLCNRNIT